MKLNDKIPGPAYVKVAAALRDAISTGEVKVGEKLPPNTQLAADFGVAVMTVRRAIDALQSEGLLRTSHGVGVFVVAPDKDNVSDVERLRMELEQLRARVERIERAVAEEPPRSQGE